MEEKIEKLEKPVKWPGRRVAGMTMWIKIEVSSLEQGMGLESIIPEWKARSMACSLEKAKQCGTS